MLFMLAQARQELHALLLLAFWLLGLLRGLAA
jgi:hypothetical protein